MLFGGSEGAFLGKGAFLGEEATHSSEEATHSSEEATHFNEIAHHFNETTIPPQTINPLSNNRHPLLPNE